VQDFPKKKSNTYERFQVSAAKFLRTALLWVITQRVVVISYRRFGTTYLSHFQGFTEFLSFEDGADSSSRNVGRKLSLLDTS